MMSFDKKTKSKKYIWRNSLIFTLCFCILFTLYPVFSFATERESKSEETVGEADNKEEGCLLMKQVKRLSLRRQ